MKRRMHFHGISLIEVMIAIAILGLASTALVKLHGTLLAHNFSNRQRAIALLLAENQLATLRQRGANQTLHSGQQKIAQDRTSYQVQWIITPHSTQKIVDLEVTVAWKNPFYQLQKIQLHSAIMLK